MVGGGLPLAMHRRETGGPGCSVCSENLYSRTGEASEMEVKLEQWHLYP